MLREISKRGVSLISNSLYIFSSLYLFIYFFFFTENESEYIMQKMKTQCRMIIVMRRLCITLSIKSMDLKNCVPLAKYSCFTFFVSFHLFSFPRIIDNELKKYIFKTMVLAFEKYATVASEIKKKKIYLK